MYACIPYGTPIQFFVLYVEKRSRNLKSLTLKGIMNVNTEENLQILSFFTFLIRLG